MTGKTGKEIAKVAVFEGKHIRKILHEGEGWFSVIDIVPILTGSSIPKRYWSDLKKKLVTEAYVEVSEKIGQLKMPVRRVFAFTINLSSWKSGPKPTSVCRFH